MKSLYKRIALLICPYYIASIGANMIIHGFEARAARKESEKAWYGPNLKKQWVDFSQSHLERMVNPRIFVPFSSFKHSLKRPLKIQVVGPKVDGIELKFDIKREEK